MISLLLLIIGQLAHSQKSFHAAPDQSFQLNLPDIFETGNYSLELIGSFNITSASQAVLTPGVYEAGGIKKRTSSESPGLAWRDQLLYVGNDAGVEVFNISQLPTITAAGTLQPLESSAAALYTVNLLTGSFLLVYGKTGGFQVFNLTSSTEISSLKVNYQMDSFIAISFYIDLNYVWAFPFNSTSIGAIRFDLLFSFTSVVFRTFTSAEFSTEITVVGFNVFQGGGYLCDAAKGVLVYDMTQPLGSIDLLPSLLSNFSHPLFFGQIQACFIDGLDLTTTTESNIIVYSLPYMKFLYAYNGKFNSSRTSINFTVSYSNSRFQVLNNSLSINSSLICDYSTEVLGWAIMGNYIIATGVTDLTVLSMQNPFIRFSPQKENYQYSATLSNGKSSWMFNVVGSYSSGLFTFQGFYEGSGYLQPSSFQGYMYGSPYVLTLPLSNYFSGNNIEYSLEISDGTANAVSKYSLLNTISTTFSYESIVVASNLLILVASNLLSIRSLVNNIAVSMFTISPKTDNALISSICTNLNFILLENFVDDNTYLDIYTTQGTWVQTIPLGNVSASSKMIATNSLVYIQRADCVEIWTIQAASISLTSSICSSTVYPQVSLLITDIAFCDGLCLLNNSSSLLYFSYNSTSYTPVTLPPNQYNSLLSTASFLIVLGADFAYKLSISAFSYNYIPLPCSGYNASVSLQLLSVQCASVFIIDLNAPTYSAIYTVIDKPGLFMLNSTASAPSIGFLSDGSGILVFSICPNYYSNLVPSNSKLCEAWAEIEVNTTNQSTEAQLTIYAQNAYAKNFAVVSISVWNSQYIAKNSSFDEESSELTSGSILVPTSNFSVEIPLDSFIGNNLTYGIRLNENSYLPQSSCNVSQGVCIQPKLAQTGKTTEGSTVYDFSISSNMLITATVNLVYVYSILDGKFTVESKFSFSQYFNSLYFTCLIVEILKEAESLICAGTFTNGIVPMYYLISADVNGTVLDSYQIYFSPQWMTVNEINQVRIYLYEGVGLYYFQLSSDNKLLFVDYFSSGSLNCSFNPVAADYYNESSIIIGDRSNGILLITDNQLIPFLSIPGNASVVDIFLLTDSVIVLMANGEGYLVSTVTFKVLLKYLKLYPGGYIPGNMQGAINKDLGLIVYPIYTYQYTGYLRVLNFTTGVIYTDSFIASNGPSFLYRRIAIQTGMAPLILHDLSSDLGYLSVNILEILQSIDTTIFYKHGSDTTLALFGQVGDNALSYSEISVSYYKKNGSSSGASSKSVPWWVWLILALALLGIMGVVGLCIRRRRKAQAEVERLIINY